MKGAKYLRRDAKLCEILEWELRHAERHMVKNGGCDFVNVPHGVVTLAEYIVVEYGNMIASIVGVADEKGKIKPGTTAGTTAGRQAGIDGNPANPG